MLVLHGPRRVPPLQPHVGTVVVHAVARLVPERPEEHAREVLVTLDISRHPRHVARRPLLFVAQRRRPRKINAMALDVCLVNNIQPVLVAQLIEQRVIGVVGTSDRVEVVSLHEADVLHHRVSANNMPGERIMLVPVDAPDGELPAVQQKPPLPYLHGPETHRDARRFVDFRILGVGVLQGDDQGVQVRILSAPQPDALASELALGHGDIV
mmetsp:Transcript_70499/g.204324  ORF Transcript_70499/g.204324 Transcript_70499/m.204324 type:complete len:211 (+) Transcript_70499:580-1212(+)